MTGPLSYFSLGRVAPRLRLRQGWDRVRRRRIVYAPAAPGGPFAGDIDSALQPAESTAAGVLAFVGDAATAAQPLESAATGRLVFAGSAASGLQPSACAAQGALAFVADGADTLQPAESTAAGSLAFVGAGASALQPVESAAEGSTDVTVFVGDAASTLQPVASAGAGTVTAPAQPQPQPGVPGFGAGLLRTTTPSFPIRKPRVRLQAIAAAEWEIECPLGELVIEPVPTEPLRLSLGSAVRAIDILPGGLAIEARAGPVLFQLEAGVMERSAVPATAIIIDPAQEALALTLLLL